MNETDVLDYLNKRRKVNKRLQDDLDIWQDVYYGMSLHTAGIMPRYTLYPSNKKYTPRLWHERYQLIFDRLFARHEREGENLRNWRYTNYKPITKAPFGQCIEVISGAIFQDSNWKIEIEDQQDNEYINQNNFSGYDLMGYLANMGLKNLMEDPNGYFVRVPAKPASEQTGQRLEVDLWFVNTKDIVFIDKGNIVFKRGQYAYWIDTETIYRYEYTDKNEYVGSEGYYSHMLGYLPVTLAGGEWNTLGFYDSYLDKAKPFSDDFVAVYSAKQMVDKEASHPYIIEVQQDCPTCEARGYEMSDCQHCNGTAHSPSDCQYCLSGTGAIHVPCHACHGSRTISRNPGQHMIVPQDKWESAKNAITFANPDMSINKQHAEDSKYVYEMILRTLHLYRTDKAESGEAKAIDQDWAYKFISKISNQIFDKILHDTIRDFIAYRNVSVNNGTLRPAKYPFTIIKPTQFKMLTAAELLDNFKLSKDSGIPDVTRRRAWLEYVDKAYNGDPIELKKVEIVCELDALAMKSSEEILSLRAANGMTQEDIFIHLNLPKWLDNMISDKGGEWFKEVKIEEVKRLVDSYKPPPNLVQQAAAGAMAEE